MSMGFCIISLASLKRQSKDGVQTSESNGREVSNTWLQDEQRFTGGPASDSYIKDYSSGLLSNSCFTTNKSSW